MRRRYQICTGFLIATAFWCMFYIQKISYDDASNKNNEMKRKIDFMENAISDQLDESEQIMDVVSLFKESIRNSPRAKQYPHVKIPHDKHAIAVIVFACNRVTVSRTLSQLIRYRPSKDKFPIIVSQDGNHVPTYQVVNSFKKDVFYMRQPNQSEITLSTKRELKFKGYYKIARHYKWALDEIFFANNFEAAIILEDDLDVSPDIFHYFEGTYPLLLNDSTLWCVSAWNDNGKAGIVDASQPQMLHRTDFFSGLGWLLTDNLWRELSPKWPPAYWDDWIREPAQRRERACVRPENSRTVTFGKIGVSNGLFFDKHLKYLRLNQKFVDFRKFNLSYLIKGEYDPQFFRTIFNASKVTIKQLAANNVSALGALKITYDSKFTFKRACKFFGLMDDFKSGVPRTAYMGVVSFMYRNRRVYLAPDSHWSSYDPTW